MHAYQIDTRALSYETNFASIPCTNTTQTISYCLFAVFATFLGRRNSQNIIRTSSPNFAKNSVFFFPSSLSANSDPDSLNLTHVISSIGRTTSRGTTTGSPQMCLRRRARLPGSLSPILSPISVVRAVHSCEGATRFVQ